MKISSVCMYEENMVVVKLKFETLCVLCMNMGIKL